MKISKHKILKRIETHSIEDLMTALKWLEAKQTLLMQLETEQMDVPNSYFVDKWEEEQHEHKVWDAIDKGVW